MELLIFYCSIIVSTIMIGLATYHLNSFRQEYKNSILEFKEVKLSIIEEVKTMLSYRREICSSLDIMTEKFSKIVEVGKRVEELNISTIVQEYYDSGVKLREMLISISDIRQLLNGLIDHIDSGDAENLQRTLKVFASGLRHDKKFDGLHRKIVSLNAELKHLIEEDWFSKVNNLKQ